MANRLFVANIPFDVTEEELTKHFSEVGPVSRVFLPLDRETGKPRGFAFVEFSNPEHAALAIQRLNQQPFKERPLVVNEARPSGSSRPVAGGSRGPNPSQRSHGTPGGASGSRPRMPASPAGDGGPVGRPPAKAKTGPGRRRKGGKRFWDEGGPARNEPLKEKVGGRFYGVDDDSSDEDDNIDFENFATSEPESDEE